MVFCYVRRSARYYVSHTLGSREARACMAADEWFVSWRGFGTYHVPDCAKHLGKTLREFLGSWHWGFQRVSSALAEWMGPIARSTGNATERYHWAQVIFQLPRAIFDCAVYPRVLQVCWVLRVSLLYASLPPSRTINEKKPPKNSNNRYNVYLMFNRTSSYYQPSSWHLCLDDTGEAACPIALRILLWLTKTQELLRLSFLSSMVFKT